MSEDISKSASMALWLAAAVQVLAIAALYYFRNDIPGIVLTLVISKSLSQMCVDFFEGERKKYWSAAFRVVPIISAGVTYLLAVKII